MNEFTMTIGGEAVAAQSTFPVINPSTGSPFADAPACSPDQLDRAVEAAQGAFPNWQKDEHPVDMRSEQPPWQYDRTQRRWQPPSLVSRASLWPR